ncbi:MAG: HD domain-containing protein [Acidobacteria bacterium]|nr:HD domain-containing protein [Acidobacteriota bacterium]
MTTAAKQRCNEELSAWSARFLQGGQAEPALKDRTRLVDEIVQEAFARTLAQAWGDGVSLLAVGGYGRRELFPYSDVDLLLLVRRTPDTAASKAHLSEFLRMVWDSGLRVSHSVRTVEECCALHEGNFELTVSLLDQRLLGGDHGLHEALRERFRKFLAVERRELLKRMCRMTRVRHGRFQETIFRLEPDVKEAPGGMRDLQTIHWLGLLKEEDGDGAVDPRHRAFLGSVRCFLHFKAGRDQNLLSFEAQDEIAAAPFSPWHDPAHWMRAYYRNASHIFKSVQSKVEAAEALDRTLLANFRDWRSRLSNSEFTVSRDMVFLRNPGELEADRELPLRLFLFLARHGLPPARETEQRLVDHVMTWSRLFRDKPPQGEFWREFLNLPHASRALRAMRSTGFLAVILPEWERIDHLVVRDFYHQYTVDEHTNVTLEILEGLKGTKEAAEKPFAELLEESLEDGWLMKLALLMHDIGKGSGRDHSEEAVRLAEKFLKRIGMGELDSGRVLFLIEKHLSLSAALQSKDLADPSATAALAEEMMTVEQLRLLTLLTYADISAVNPSAMTPWRMEQLWSAYRVVYRQLTGSLTSAEGADPHKAFGEVKPATAEFLEGLPQRYMWTHTAAEADTHAGLYDGAKERGAEVRLERRSGAWKVTLVAPDRPFLLASIAGTISSFGLNILKAEAFANRHGFVADSFAFTDPNRSLDLNPPEQERLRDLLKRVAVGQLRVEDLLKHRPVKPPPSRLGAVEATVSVDSEASTLATVLEVVAQDRPGLLYHLASAISRANCNIEVVLVDTEAHKALDVFHVTQDGRKLSEEEAEKLRLALLAACRP